MAAINVNNWQQSTPPEGRGGGDVPNPSRENLSSLYGYLTISYVNSSGEQAQERVRNEDFQVTPNFLEEAILSMNVKFSPPVAIGQGNLLLAGLRLIRDEHCQLQPVDGTLEWVTEGGEEATDVVPHDITFKFEP